MAEGRGEEEELRRLRERRNIINFADHTRPFVDRPINRPTAQHEIWDSGLEEERLMVDNDLSAVRFTDRLIMESNIQTPESGIYTITPDEILDTNPTREEALAERWEDYFSNFLGHEYRVDEPQITRTLNEGEENMSRWRSLTEQQKFEYVVNAKKEELEKDFSIDLWLHGTNGQLKPSTKVEGRLPVLIFNNYTGFRANHEVLKRTPVPEEFVVDINLNVGMWIFDFQGRPENYVARWIDINGYEIARLSCYGILHMIDLFHYENNRFPMFEEIMLQALEVAGMGDGRLANRKIDKLVKELMSIDSNKIKHVEMVTSVEFDKEAWIKEASSTVKNYIETAKVSFESKKC